MNYLRNLLRRLWPFVTRREHEELKTWVRKLQSKLAVAELSRDTLKDNTDEVHRKLNDEITKLQYQVAELEQQLAGLRETVLAVYAAVNEDGGDVWQVIYATPKKKPRRKKPAKKGKKK